MASGPASVVSLLGEMLPGEIVNRSSHPPGFPIYAPISSISLSEGQQVRLEPNGQVNVGSCHGNEDERGEELHNAVMRSVL